LNRVTPTLKGISLKGFSRAVREYVVVEEA